MLRPRILFSSSTSALFSCHPHRHRHFLSSQHRWISTTPPLQNSWMDKIKGVFTGQKTSSPDATSASTSSESFTLLRKLLLSPLCQFLTALLARSLIPLELCVCICFCVHFQCKNHILVIVFFALVCKLLPFWLIDSSHFNFVFVYVFAFILNAKIILW